MIYLSIALATFIVLFVVVLYHSYRQNKLINAKNEQIKDLLKQLDEQKKYHTLYNNNVDKDL